MSDNSRDDFEDILKWISRNLEEGQKAADGLRKISDIEQDWREDNEVLFKDLRERAENFIEKLASNPTDEGLEDPPFTEEILEHLDPPHNIMKGGFSVGNTKITPGRLDKSKFTRPFFLLGMLSRLGKGMTFGIPSVSQSKELKVHFSFLEVLSNLSLLFAQKEYRNMFLKGVAERRGVSGFSNYNFPFVEKSEGRELSDKLYNYLTSCVPKGRVHKQTTPERFYNDHERFYRAESQAVHVFSTTPGVIVPEVNEEANLGRKDLFRKRYLESLKYAVAEGKVKVYYQIDLRSTAEALIRSSLSREEASKLIGDFLSNPGVEVSYADFSERPWKYHAILSSPQVGIAFCNRPSMKKIFKGFLLTGESAPFDLIHKRYQEEDKIVIKELDEEIDREEGRERADKVINSWITGFDRIREYVSRAEAKLGSLHTNLRRCLHQNDQAFSEDIQFMRPLCHPGDEREEITRSELNDLRDLEITFKKLREQLAVMEEGNATKEALTNSISHLLEGNRERAYLELEKVDPEEAMTLLESTYQLVEGLGYSREDVASELGLQSLNSEGQAQGPVKPIESDETMPLKELPEVFDRSYGTLRDWLNKKDLSDYSLKDGKTNRFSKESLEAFVSRELEPSHRYSTLEIQSIYDRIAESFGGEATEVRGDLFESNRHLAPTKKLEILKDRLGKAELYQVVEEVCTDQQSDYIKEYIKGTPQKEIAQEEGVASENISQHIANGTNHVWDSVAEQLE